MDAIMSKPGISHRELAGKFGESEVLTGPMDEQLDMLILSGMVAEDWPEDSPCTTYRALIGAVVAV